MQFRKILSLLDHKQQKKFYILIANLALLSIFEMLGAFALIPFISLASKSSISEAQPIIKKLYLRGGFQEFDVFLTYVGLITLVLVILSSLFKILSQWMKQKFTWDISHQIGTKLLQIYLKKPYKYYLKTNSSKIVSNLVVESSRVTTNALFPLVNIVVALVSMMIVLVILLSYNAKVTLLLSIIFSLLFGIIFFVVRPTLSRLSKLRMNLNVRRFKSLKEVIAGIKTFKINNSLDFFYSRYYKVSENLSQIQPKVSLISVVPKNLTDILLFGAIISFILISIIYELDLKSHVTLLTIYAISGFKLLPLLNILFNSFVNMRHATESVDAIYSDLYENRDVIFERGTNDRHIFKEAISMNGLRFKYEGTSDYILDGLEMKIEKGDMIALLGATGSGKTTLIDALVGLLKCETGDFLIDDLLINQSNLLPWQNIFSYVTQDVYLFDDSLKSNILLDLEIITSEKLETIIEIVQLTDFVDNLADNLETEVGERGVKLSGGQKQRIGLARALVRNPEVLILDEATNALDVKTEKKFFKALKEAFPDITIIIITHRLSVIEDMDMIYYMSNGKIKSKGTYQEMKNNSSDFKILLS